MNSRRKIKEFENLSMINSNKGYSVPVLSPQTKESLIESFFLDFLSIVSKFRQSPTSFLHEKLQTTLKDLHSEAKALDFCDSNAVESFKLRVSTFLFGLSLELNIYEEQQRKELLEFFERLRSI